jgi:hypothetical protein
VIYGIVPGREVELHRIVRSDLREDPVMLNSFKSNYELSDPPRRVERDAAVIHMGISTYLTSRAATETALRFPKLGDYIARLLLGAGQGVNLAQTGHPGHLTVWGDPVKLLESVVDTTSVRH